jgi:hypothetical protein
MEDPFKMGLDIFHRSRFLNPSAMRMFGLFEQVQ